MSGAGLFLNVLVVPSYLLLKRQDSFPVVRAPSSWLLNSQMSHLGVRVSTHAFVGRHHHSVHGRWRLAFLEAFPYFLHGVHVPLFSNPLSFLRHAKRMFRLNLLAVWPNLSSFHSDIQPCTWVYLSWWAKFFFSWSFSLSFFFFLKLW